MDEFPALAGCSPAEPASASPADATLRLHPRQCQRNFIERYFVTVLVVSAQGSTASHLHRLLAFFDSLLRCSPLVDAHYRPARHLQVAYDKPHSREQLPQVELHLRHHPTRRFPASGPMEKALVPDHRFLRASSSSVSRSRLSFAESRIAYFTPCSSSVFLNRESRYCHRRWMRPLALA